MRWDNKARQFDNKYKKYKELLEKNNDRFAMFGTGIVGKECVRLFKKCTWTIVQAFDNDNSKWGLNFEGIKVESFSEYKKGEYLLVLCVGNKNLKELKMQVEQEGLKEGIDYIVFNELKTELIPLMKLYEEKVLYLDVVELAVTERCTLKCKKCAHACGLVDIHDKSKDFPIEKVKKSADVFFSYVDYVNEFYLIGGETFLYENLAEAIRYVGEKYRDRIDRFIITTNGTIIPSKECMLLMSHYKMTIYISNYSKQLPQLAKHYKRLCEELSNYKVDYSLSEYEREWFDYGFDYVNHRMDENIVMNIHDECFTPCREIRENKFYYCIQARSVSENMNMNVGNNDYLDIGKLDTNRWEDKVIVYEYSKGYCDKGYIDMCNYCNGSNSKNILIPCAEQMEA